MKFIPVRVVIDLKQWQIYPWRLSFVQIGVIQPNDPINVIPHNHIFFNLRHIADIFFYNPSIRFRDDEGIVPYDFALLKTHRILFARFREGIRSANAFKILLS